MITFDARLTALSASDLLAALDRLASATHDLTADLVALLGECDERKLYAVEGYESLFEFAVRRLRLSESQAYHRIQAARAARCFPLVLDRLRAGRVTLTAVALLREHLTEANHLAVLDWAEGKRKREVELFVRGLDPRPDVASSLRRLAAPRAVAGAAAADQPPGPAPSFASTPSPAAGPAAAVPLSSDHPGAPSLSLATEAARAPLSAPASEPPLWATGAPVLTHTSQSGTTGGSAGLPSQVARPPSFGAGGQPVLDGPAESARRGVPDLDSPPTPLPARRADIHPLAPDRYSLRVTISQDTYDKLQRARDLLRHAGGIDPAVVLDRALTLLVAQLERRKAGAAQVPGRTSGRRRAAKPGAATGAQPRRHSPAGTAGASAPAAVPVQAGDSAQPDAGPSGAAGPEAGEGLPVRQGMTRPATREPRSRYIPAAIRRAVWDRDGARCAYVSPGGVRCGATARLEFHHRVPFAEGGASSVDNVTIACHRHNAVEAARWFNFDQSKFGPDRSG